MSYSNNGTTGFDPWDPTSNGDSRGWDPTQVGLIAIMQGTVKIIIHWTGGAPIPKCVNVQLDGIAQAISDTGWANSGGLGQDGLGDPYIQEHPDIGTAQGTRYVTLPVDPTTGSATLQVYLYLMLTCATPYVGHIDANVSITATVLSP